MASEFPGGGFGTIPSNDPAERAGGGTAPGVNREGFDAKYLGDGTAAWDAPGKVGNLPKDSFPQSFTKRPPRATKPVNPALYG